MLLKYKLCKPLIIFMMFINPAHFSTIHATDFVFKNGIKIESVTLDIETNNKMGMSSSRKQYHSGEVWISPITINGKILYKVGAPGPFEVGCNMDGRWSTAAPVFDIGARKNSTVKCSDPTKQNHKNSISLMSYGKFTDNYPVMKGKFSVNESCVYSNSILYSNSTAEIEIRLSSNSSLCSVDNIRFTASEQSKFRSYLITTRSFSKRRSLF